MGNKINETMTNQTQKNTFDAIVVGSGISGGWAAKELTQAGIKNIGIGKGAKCSAYYRLSHSL